jgi:prevent-host-death family protein
MKAMSARDAKHQFGLLIDTARAEPVVIEKHGRPVAVLVQLVVFPGSACDSGREPEDRPHLHRGVAPSQLRDPADIRAVEDGWSDHRGYRKRQELTDARAKA